MSLGSLLSVKSIDSSDFSSRIPLALSYQQDWRVGKALQVLVINSMHLHNHIDRSQASSTPYIVVAVIAPAAAAEVANAAPE
jgi:hypothetical protein